MLQTITINTGRGRPSGIFLGFYKTRHILLSNSANCIVLYVQSFWHNTGVWQTDRRKDGQIDRRQTDGRNCHS